MPHKVLINWVRRANVVEQGGASVLVSDPKDMTEIRAKIDAREFHEFLVTDRNYEDESWSFEPIKEASNDE